MGILFALLHGNLRLKHFSRVKHWMAEDFFIVFLYS